MPLDQAPRGEGLRPLRLWHAQHALYSDAKAAEYRTAATKDPVKWGRLIANAETFDRVAAFHRQAVESLNQMFAAADVVENDPALGDWREATSAPWRSKSAPGVKLFTFRFKGLALAGGAVVAAGDEETAASMVTTPTGDKAVLTDTRELTIPSVVHYDDGDY